jgi:hypothetical protein
MGDWADYYVDRMIDGHLGTRRKRNKSRGEFVTCKHCGAKRLRWRQDEHGKWYLMRGGKRHECPPDRVLADFEDLTKGGR